MASALGVVGIILFLYREHQEITPARSNGSLVESGNEIAPVANVQPKAPATIPENGWCGSVTNGYSGIAGVGFYQYSDGKLLPAAAPDVFREFANWIETFRSGHADLDEGMRLAQERRDSLKDLIRQDPELALRLGIPEIDRDGLPEPVVALLEEHVSAKGDWQSGYQCFIPGQLEVARITRPG